MTTNRGKQFEQVIKDAFESVSNTNVIRLHDQTNGYVGSKNPCDFIVYHYPHQYCIECKTVHGNTFPFTNITNYQYSELCRFSKIIGCYAGILCWWVDKDVTRFIPIQLIHEWKLLGQKSTRYDFDEVGYQDGDVFCPAVTLGGTKKRVFFDYDIEDFFDNFE